ncbi:hypothetical protein SAY86_015955 [Trapa natans]|uniref:Protein kinase domain-containing protein n=1 Tax=Trapa natans TaxID=22666 RepID=A0AAN7LF72_TRANT|nr:hypothetical protein SAY86_015955 [Trapa natans]
MSCFSFLKRAGPSLSRHTVEIDEEVSSIQNTKLYTYQELSAATQGFSQAKKIGEGGFGSVYKVNPYFSLVQGYLAPEYALRGQLTRKADVYSFGVLLLEIICGRSNIRPSPPSEDKYLLVKVWKLLEEGELVTIVDSSLGGDFDAEEATNFLRIGLLCTQDIPMLRPSMSTVVKMLKSEVDVSGEKISVPGILSEYKVKINLSKMDTGEFSDMLSAESSVKRDTFSSGDETFSYATMTFNSIYDRN